MAQLGGNTEGLVSRLFQDGKVLLLIIWSIWHCRLCCDICKICKTNKLVISIVVFNFVTDYLQILISSNMKVTNFYDLRRKVITRNWWDMKDFTNALEKPEGLIDFLDIQNVLFSLHVEQDLQKKKN